MNILSFDTVLNKSYVGILFEGKKIFKTIDSDEKNYHSAYLIRVIKDLLVENNISIKDFNYIAINKGTGSFTGIRVGMAIAKVLSGQLNIKTVQLNSFEILSKAYKTKNIMTNAGRNSVFYCTDGYNPKLISFEEALTKLNGSTEIFVTDNLQKNEKFAQFKDRFISYEEKSVDLAPIELELSVEKALNNDTYDVYETKPLYIQTPPVFSK